MTTASEEMRKTVVFMNKANRFIAACAIIQIACWVFVFSDIYYHEVYLKHSPSNHYKQVK